MILWIKHQEQAFEHQYHLEDNMRVLQEQSQPLHQTVYSNYLEIHII